MKVNKGAPTKKNTVNQAVGRPLVFFFSIGSSDIAINNYRTLTNHVSIWPNVLEVKQHEQTTLI